MNIEQAVKTELESATALTALIGERLYYVTAPQNVTAPYVVMTKVSSVREHVHEGAAGLATARFQFSIFSTTYYLAKQIAAQIQAALQGKSETIGTAPGVRAAILYDNETDFYEPETKLHHIALDFITIHQED